MIDELVEGLISAPDRETLVAYTRALDRVLLSGHYVVPHWHIRSFRLVYWNMFGKPIIAPKYGISFPNTWWFDEGKYQALLANSQSSVEMARSSNGQIEDTPAASEASDPVYIEDIAGAERNAMIYLACLGIMIVVIVLYLRRRAKKPS